MADNNSDVRSGYLRDFERFSIKLLHNCIDDKQQVECYATDAGMFFRFCDMAFQVQYCPICGHKAE